MNANWSQPGNWSPVGVPQPSDSLTFPFEMPNRDMINDLPAGTSFGSLTFNDAAYTVSGNLMTLTGDVFGLTSMADLKLGASLVLTFQLHPPASSLRGSKSAYSGGEAVADAS